MQKFLFNISKIKVILQGNLKYFQLTDFKWVSACEIWILINAIRTYKAVP